MFGYAIIRRDRLALVVDRLRTGARERVEVRLCIPVANFRRLVLLFVLFVGTSKSMSDLLESLSQSSDELGKECPLFILLRDPTGI